jgi:hypothetical protein
MGAYLIAALLVPLFLNQLDTLVGKLMTLRAALKRRKWSR